MIALSIDLTKIDKKFVYIGKKGEYLSVVMHERKDGPDKHGNTHFVTQDFGKEERARMKASKELPPIIGNGRVIERQPNF